MTRSTARLRAVAGVAAVTVAALLAGCVSWFMPVQAPTASVPTGEHVDVGFDRYYHQVLAWSGCGDGMQCATAVAPLDWTDPAGDTIELALIRQYATSGEPVGSLLVNPGGPGGSGVSFVRDSVDFAVSDTLQRDFTIVGFDPRGVGASTPVSCTADDAELDAYIYDITPGMRGSDAWLAAATEANREFGEGCATHTGALLAHVDTGSAARDLDMLRAALGDATLNFLGYSYGTYLGARYAELFPQKAGRLVLDGAIDPAASEFDVTRAQARGFEAALEAYLTDCLGRSDCPFSGGLKAARDRIARLMVSLDRTPLTGADGRKLGASTMFSALILPLYNRQNWSVLDDLLVETLAGKTETAFRIADSYNDRSADGHYLTNSTEAFTAINCLDYPSAADPTVMREQAAILAEEAPVFGPWMAYGGTMCPVWPVASDAVRAPILAPGSPDILVVGTTGDPATPYAWAEALAEQLENGHLITYRGEGHTAYGESECITTAVDAFLREGKVPAAGFAC